MSFPNVILSDVFKSEDCKKILQNKYILFLGDSVTRGMYKDLVKILQSDDYLTDKQLKLKGEFVHEKDVLLQGGQYDGLTNNTNYTEVREFKTPYHLVRFYFITKCYSDYLISICDDIKKQTEKPDVVIMNSGCWDITRYGETSIYEYKQNLPLGIFSLLKCLPCYTLFIWVTTMPISRNVQGGFMVPEAECHRSKLREDILEANKYAATVIDEFKLDLIDLHFYFHNQIHRRAKDGIHWDVTGHRRITNLIMNHICEAWDIKTPGRTLITKEIEDFRNSWTQELKSYEDVLTDEEETEPNRKMPRKEDDALLPLPYNLVSMPAYAPVPLLSLQTAFFQQNTFHTNEMKQMGFVNTDQFQAISTRITNQNQFPQISVNSMNQNQFQLYPNNLPNPFVLNDFNNYVGEPTSNFNNKKKRPRNP